MTNGAQWPLGTTVYTELLLLGDKEICVSAAVLYQLSYEHLYSGSCQICWVHFNPWKVNFAQVLQGRQIACTFVLKKPTNSIRLLYEIFHTHFHVWKSIFLAWNMQILVDFVNYDQVWIGSFSLSGFWIRNRNLFHSGVLEPFISQMLE